MFFVNLPVNMKEQAAIERRRRDEQQRISRIFNEKYRTIGIDRTALDEQVKEREKMKRLEKERNDALNREMIRNDLKMIFLEQEQIDQERRYARQLNEYRQLHQRAEDSREWDLNNPNQWKLITPTRIADEDSRLGPSSAQIFAGEDLRANTRKRAQQEQMKHYYQIQSVEKDRKQEREHWANLLYEHQNDELIERSRNLEELENQCRRMMNMSVRQYNEILANEMKNRSNEIKRKESEERLAELANTCFSDLLLETSNRDMPDRWKGMTKEELDRIRHEQLEQIDEQQRKKFDQKRFDYLWNQYDNAITKQESLIERQMDDDHRQSCQRIAEENQKLAITQRDQQHHLNTVVYRSSPSAAFYQQFNTTSR